MIWYNVTRHRLEQQTYRPLGGEGAADTPARVRGRDRHVTLATRINLLRGDEKSDTRSVGTECNYQEHSTHVQRRHYQELPEQTESMYLVRCHRSPPACPGK